MKFITPIYLLSISNSTDDAGDTTQADTSRKVFVNVSSIGMNEFYQAHNLGFKPELKVYIRDFEYKGESKIKYKNEEYRVIKTYDRQDGVIELTCSKGVD